MTKVKTIQLDPSQVELIWASLPGVGKGAAVTVVAFTGDVVWVFIDKMTREFTDAFILPEKKDLTFNLTPGQKLWIMADPQSSSVVDVSLMVEEK